MSAKKILNTESSLIPGIIDLVCKQNFWKTVISGTQTDVCTSERGEGGEGLVF